VGTLVRPLWRAAGIGAKPLRYLPSWWGHPFNKHSLSQTDITVDKKQVSGDRHVKKRDREETENRPIFNYKKWSGEPELRDAIIPIDNTKTYIRNVGRKKKMQPRTYFLGHLEVELSCLIPVGKQLSTESGRSRNKIEKRVAIQKWKKYSRPELWDALIPALDNLPWMHPEFEGTPCRLFRLGIDGSCYMWEKMVYLWVGGWVACVWVYVNVHPEFEGTPC